MRELNGLRQVKNTDYGVGTHPNTVPYNTDPPRSRPGGWAYPGTMTLGDGGSVNETSGVLKGGLTYVEDPKNSTRTASSGVSVLLRAFRVEF